MDWRAGDPRRLRGGGRADFHAIGFPAARLRGEQKLSRRAPDVEQLPSLAGQLQRGQERVPALLVCLGAARGGADESGVFVVVAIFVVAEEVLALPARV